MLVALFAGALLTTACQAGVSDPPAADPPSTDPESRTTAPIEPARPTDAEPVRLVFGVFGNDDEVEAWQTAVDSYNSVFDADVRLRSWRTWRQADAAMRGGGLPDVFMVNRRGLKRYLDRELIQPVDELLDVRGVNFGDDYSRDAMEEFSVETSLACMPLSISPMVMYLNTDLVDFDAMARRGLDVPSTPERWTFEQFAAAANFAARPRRAINGVHIDPTLTGLAPFLHSGGATLFDEETEPSSLAFSSEETNAALERSLTVLRDAQLTPTPVQLASRSAREMFLDGDLGMIAGFRSLTPRLRRQGDLEFDVMPMPVLDSAATVGDLEGVCLANDTSDTAAAADLIAFAMQESTLRTLARAGRTVPANVAVGNSSDFLQGWDDPQNSRVFITSMRAVKPMPLLDNGSALNEAVSPLLGDLLTEPVIDLPLLTAEIDATSRTVLSPETSSPSASPQ